MFKNKLKKLVQNKKELPTASFEILKDDQTSKLIGGLSNCGKLHSCGKFLGTCPNLISCSNYTEPQ